MSHHDDVHRPRHYTSHTSGVECLDITRHMTFVGGNALKYVWRAKNGRQDLEKAHFYLCDAIEQVDPIYSHYRMASRLLQKVIAHETGLRRSFFQAILYMNIYKAREIVAEMISPDDPPALSVDDWPLGEVSA
jgi:hypothetical protein